MLIRIVEWYNEIKSKVLPCEYDIIKQELDVIDKKLSIAFETAKWCDYDEVYIIDVHSDLNSLQNRIMKAKANIEKLKANTKSWGNAPMFHRPEKGDSTLMNPDDFDIYITRRQNEIFETKSMLSEIVDENFRLLFNLPLRKHTWKAVAQAISSKSSSSLAESITTMRSLGSLKSSRFPIHHDRPSETNVNSTDKAVQMDSESWITLRPHGVPSAYAPRTPTDCDEIIKTEEQKDLFKPYEKYLDEIVLSELLNSMRVSLSHIKNEMENRSNKPNMELFESKLQLQPPHLLYFPILDESPKRNRGLFKSITYMNAQIFNTATLIPMVQQAEVNFEIFEKCPFFSIL